MRLIDGDELCNVLMRSDCSTREKINNIVDSQPSFRAIPLFKIQEIENRIAKNEVLSAAERAAIVATLSAIETLAI